MADSLRDQLIAAGFDAPKKEARKKPKTNAGSSSAKGKAKGKQTRQGPQPRRNKSGSPKSQGSGKGPNQQQKSSDDAIAARKKLKAEIKVLIDENKTEPWKGDTVYRYLVDKKIRELYVTEVLHPKLTTREVAITRFNGETFIVPRATGQAIKQKNPQWSVFNLEDNETAADETDSEYADFQVPDDLQW